VPKGPKSGLVQGKVFSEKFKNLSMTVTAMFLNEKKNKTLFPLLKLNFNRSGIVLIKNNGLIKEKYLPLEYSDRSKY
jgi:hypothetical protein